MQHRSNASSTNSFIVSDDDDDDEETSTSDDDDYSDWSLEDGEEGVDLPPNTALLSGPTGVGKTATVHALARQLGFKVLEVNASSLRGGRQVIRTKIMGIIVQITPLTVTLITVIPHLQ